MADVRKRPPKLSSRTESFKEGGEPSSDAKRVKHSTQSSSEEDGEIKMKLQVEDKQPSSSQRHRIQRQHHHHSDDERRRDGSSSRNREGARLHSRVGGVSRSQKPDRSPRHRREKHGSERTIDHSSRQYRSRDDVRKTAAYRVHRKDRDGSHRGRDSSKERSQDRRGLDESEDLRRVLDRKRREERQSVSDVSSEEENEEKEVLERVSVSSDGEVSDEGEESESPKEEIHGKSDAEEPSSLTTKESRWLSRDSGSENEEEGSEEQATTVTQRDTVPRHRQIGGYGVKDEEMSGSESEDVSAQLEEDLKELEGGEVEEHTPEDPVLPDYYPGIYGCRSVENYEWLNRIEEGTFGVVFRGKEKRTNEIVALKKLKMEKEKEGFPITSLREVCCLLKAKHPNIVHVREIVVGSNMDKIYIVMDFIEHDLKALMETMKQPFLVGEVKTLMLQLLRGVHHLHDNWILHRDLKTSNLLLSHKGILKIGDFGLARDYGSPLKPYTPIVVTLWYRSPELLLGEKLYSTAVDMWSVGCIFGELLLHKPLFQGKSEIDQLNKIFQEMGTPNEKIWPKYPELPHVKDYSFKEQPFLNLRKKLPITVLTNSGFDLINRFLTYDPEKRISAESALLHEYFQESPLPVDPSMFPTWPAKSENVRKSTRERSPSAPIGGAAFQSLNEDEDSSSFSLSTSQKGQAASGPGFTLKF